MRVQLAFRLLDPDLVPYPYALIALGDEHLHWLGLTLLATGTLIMDACVAAALFPAMGPLGWLGTARHERKHS